MRSIPSRLYFGNCENSPAIQPIWRTMPRIHRLRCRALASGNARSRFHIAARRKGARTAKAAAAKAPPANRAAGRGRSPSDFSPAHAAAYSSHSRIACHYARGSQVDASAGAALGRRDRWNILQEEIRDQAFVVPAVVVGHIGIAQAVAYDLFGPGAAANILRVSSARSRWSSDWINSLGVPAVFHRRADTAG